MNPNQAPDDDDKLQQVKNPLAVMQPGERVVCEIRRHPFGLLGTYLAVAVIIAVALAAAILVPTLLPDISAQTKLGAVLGALVAACVAGLYAWVVVYIYKENRWVVTSDSITEITQVGLFNKQTSQLSLANLEDVTVDQAGLIPSLLGFGTLHVETAGEHSKFLFPFCPDPNGTARKIIAAHEQYIASRPEEMREFNRPLSAVQNYNQPSGPVAGIQQ